MNIIVLAAASRKGGARSIFTQFLKYLSIYKGNDKYYIFKDGNVDAPIIDGVEYIVDNNHSISHRIYFDFIGLREWCRKRNITPDLVISFQNSASSLKCRQIVYYHQSLPFYPECWNPLRKKERALFFYTKIYPLLVKCSLRGDIDVVVQTETLRSLFSKYYRFNIEKTHALFPDIAKISVENIKSEALHKETHNFIYPAIGAKYKRHILLVEAIALLKEHNYAEWENIRIYLTIQRSDYAELVDAIKDAGLERQFVFLGQIPYSQLLSYYKAADALLFPSTIETIGLPLLEAAIFGLPVIATDKDYAKDVLKSYMGATHIDSFSPKPWAEAIKVICSKHPKYKPLVLGKSSWPDFFELIRINISEH